MKNFLRNMASLIIAVAMNMAALIIAVAEKIYQMANIISGFAEHKPSEISGSNLNDVFVG